MTFCSYQICFLPSHPCDSMNPGDSVVVLFTKSTGVDPHKLLVEKAMQYKDMSVYFGLPGFPQNNAGPDLSLMSVYQEWVSRIMEDHTRRYATLIPPGNHPVTLENGRLPDARTNPPTLYDIVKGYYLGDQCSLLKVYHDPLYIYHCKDVYGAATFQVHNNKKLLAVSASIDLRKDFNGSVLANTEGFRMVINGSLADVIIIDEGRGYGTGCYYWPTQQNIPIVSNDPVLDKIIRTHNPDVKPYITYREYFTASNQEVYNITSYFKTYIDIYKHCFILILLGKIKKINRSLDFLGKFK